MVTKHHGWAVASQGLFRTLDGGVNWWSVTPPGVKGVSGSSADWFFLDATTAWLLVNEEHAVESRGVLFSTTDGGKYWSGSEVPFTSARLFITADERQTIGWALKRYGPASGSEPVDLYRMERGGHWVLVHRGEGPSNPAPGRDSLPFAGLKNAVGFLPDGKAGWVTVEYRPPGQLGLYVTSDCGKTWRVPDVPIPLIWGTVSSMCSRPGSLLKARHAMESSPSSFTSSRKGRNTAILLSCSSLPKTVEPPGRRRLSCGRRGTGP